MEEMQSAGPAVKEKTEMTTAMERAKQVRDAEIYHVRNAKMLKGMIKLNDALIDLIDNFYRSTPDDLIVADENGPVQCPKCKAQRQVIFRTKTHPKGICHYCMKEIHAKLGRARTKWLNSRQEGERLYG